MNEPQTPATELSVHEDVTAEKTGEPHGTVPSAIAEQVITAESNSTTTQHTPVVVKSWIWDVMVSIAASVFIIFFLYQPVHVEGTSMLPRLEDQDLLLINKFAYTKLGGWMGDNIRHGDVVVFHYPHDETKSYIKRVIAVPGDRLSIDHGTVMLNGVAQKEPYVPVKYQDDRSLAEETIPAGDYFVMGDHRSISSDSRDFGFVRRGLIYGKAAFVYWPVDQAGVVR